MIYLINILLLFGLNDLTSIKTDHSNDTYKKFNMDITKPCNSESNENITAIKTYYPMETTSDDIIWFKYRQIIRMKDSRCNNGGYSVRCDVRGDQCTSGFNFKCFELPKQ